MRAALLALFATVTACGSSAGSSASSSAASSSSSSSTSGSGGQAPIGGDRPVDVIVPSGYSADKPAPLLLMLHGYTVDGNVEELYLGLAPEADARGFLYAHPDGTVDKGDHRFWNATDACCNYDGSTVDDAAYLARVIDEIEQRYAVDPKRVYLLGHSNGGFMAYREACDHADKIAAVVSLAGALWKDPAKCKASEPVAVLQVHGDKDAEVLYAGSPGTGSPGNGPYPGALETTTDWAKIDGCATGPDTSPKPLDLETTIPGAETKVERWGSCKAGGAAELWTIQGAQHIPNFNDGFKKGAFDFFVAHPKP